jgi:uncharacterized repeat protein (TIGR01451 family)
MKAFRRLTIALLACSMVTAAAPARAAGTLTARVRTSVSVAHVDGAIRYAITIENGGSRTIRSVTIRDFVDASLDVVAVPIIDRVAAAGLSTLGENEEIFWIVKKLVPGERVTVAWKGLVTERGNGRLQNIVRLEGSDGSTAEVTTVTFLFPTRCFLSEGPVAVVT